jgi:hypothetical protein
MPVEPCGSARHTGPLGSDARAPVCMRLLPLYSSAQPTCSLLLRRLPLPLPVVQADSCRATVATPSWSSHKRRLQQDGSEPFRWAHPSAPRQDCWAPTCSGLQAALAMPARGQPAASVDVGQVACMPHTLQASAARAPVGCAGCGFDDDRMERPAGGG